MGKVHFTSMAFYTLTITQAVGITRVTWEYHMSLEQSECNHLCGFTRKSNNFVGEPGFVWDADLKVTSSEVAPR